MIVFLDSGILGLLSSPYQAGEARECSEWLYRLLSRSVYVVSSDICDYEVRRGLKLALIDRPVKSGLKQLDALTNVIDFLPLTKEVLEIASDLWAQARSQGKATANDKNIDGDMIIAAHWSILNAKYPGREVVVVTTNVKHLGYFTNAYTWQDINI
jgi:predicted nucleic acid-binding protein